MTILIFGSGGQLGYELMRQGKARQLDIQGVDFPQTDRVEPIKTSDYPTAVRRPAYSARQCDLVKQNFGISTRPWSSSLKKTIHDILSGSDD